MSCLMEFGPNIKVTFSGNERNEDEHEENGACKIGMPIFIARTYTNHTCPLIDFLKKELNKLRLFKKAMKIRIAKKDELLKSVGSNFGGNVGAFAGQSGSCLLYTSPSPRDS